MKKIPLLSSSIRLLYPSPPPSCPELRVVVEMWGYPFSAPQACSGSGKGSGSHVITSYEIFLRSERSLRSTINIQWFQNQAKRSLSLRISVTVPLTSRLLHF